MIEFIVFNVPASEGIRAPLKTALIAHGVSLERLRLAIEEALRRCKGTGVPL